MFGVCSPDRYLSKSVTSMFCGVLCVNLWSTWIVASCFDNPPPDILMDSGVPSWVRILSMVPLYRVVPFSMYTSV